MGLQRYTGAYNYLLSVVKDRLNGQYGTHDAKYDKKYESTLVRCFEDAIHYDGCERYFLVGNERLYTYNGKHYETAGNGVDMLAAIVKKVLHTLGVADMYEQGAYRRIAVNCIDAMRYDEDAQFIPNRRYVVFTNTVLDIITRQVYNFDMRFRTDVVLNFPYSEGNSLLWNKVIEQTIPHPEHREAFQQFCGSLLIDRSKYSIEFICYLVGRGRNGKSVVTGAIANMFGDKLISNYSPQELFKDADRKYNRAGLVGKIANFSDDVTASDYSGGMLKQFVSGHKMAARNPYGKPFDLTDIPLMCCCVNEMPPTADNSEGNNRRILPIECPNRVSDKDADPELSAKLSTNEAKIAIFNWVLQGAWRVLDQKGKIELGEDVKRFQAIAVVQTSTVHAWIREYDIHKADTPPDPKFRAKDPNWRTTSQWYGLYVEWCRRSGEKPEKWRKVSNAFLEFGFPHKKESYNIYYHALIGLEGGSANIGTNLSEVTDAIAQSRQAAKEIIPVKPKKLPF